LKTFGVQDVPQEAAKVKDFEAFDAVY